MKSGLAKILVVASFFILFSSFSYKLLSRNLWDSDFWWHISTGRYIAQNSSLPQEDPFSFTSALEENKNLAPERESHLLSQYWLAQLAMYLLYENFGAKGIIILRSCLLLLFLFAVFWGLHRVKRTRFYVSFVLTFLVYLSAIPFTGERPVLFTILFSVIVFLILEDFTRNRGKKIYFLPLLMLLWSNLHGGFILGAVIILTFMAGESLNALFKRGSLEKKELLTLCLVGAVSIMASYFNPDGFSSFVMVFSFKYKHFTEYIQEYQPPFWAYMEKLSPVNWGYVSLVLLFPVVLARPRKISFTYLILLPGLLYMSLTSLRFVIYYTAMGSVILGGELDLLIGRLLKKNISGEQDRKLSLALAAALFVSAAAYFAGTVEFRRFDFAPAVQYSVPKGGVDFIENNRLPGRIYNTYMLGGYLTWRLYPWKKNFIDSRGVNYTVMFEHAAIENVVRSLKLDKGTTSDSDHKSEGKPPLWERLLDHYDINLIFLLPVNEYGEIPPIMFEAAESDKWVPVYAGQLSILFIRNTEDNKEIIEKFRLSKENVYNSMLFQVGIRAFHDRNNPRYMASMGDIFYHLGRMDDALTAYEYALNRMPGNESLRARINRMRSRINRQRTSAG